MALFVAFMAAAALSFFAPSAPEPPAAGTTSAPTWTLAQALDLVEHLVLGLGGLAAVTTMILFLASARGSEGPVRTLWRLPYLPYFAWAQLFLWAGLAAGRSLSAGDPGEAGAVLAAVGLGGLLYQVLPVFVSLVLPVPQPRAPSEIRRIIAVMLFGGLLTYGLLLSRGAGELTLGPLAGALVLATILGAARWVGALFAPFAPSLVRGSERSPREPLVLLALLVSAIAPLGGLVIPGWIFVRHRWWPRLKRRLLIDRGPGSPSLAGGPVRS